MSSHPHIFTRQSLLGRHPQVGPHVAKALPQLQLNSWLSFHLSSDVQCLQCYNAWPERGEAHKREFNGF